MIRTHVNATGSHHITTISQRNKPSGHVNSTVSMRTIRVSISVFRDEVLVNSVDTLVLQSFSVLIYKSSKTSPPCKQITQMLIRQLVIPESSLKEEEKLNEMNQEVSQDVMAT